MYQKHSIFYGYRILAVTFLCALLFAGCSIASFSLFVIPLQSDFGWGRGQIMVAFMMSQVLTGIASPFVGALIDHYGARWVMSVGAFVGGLGFVSLSFIENIWHYYGGYVITAIGMAAIGPVASSAVVSNWFKKRRGTAIGIMSIGIGMGPLTMPLLVGGYLIPSFDWRASYLALAVLLWILIPLVLVVVRTKPIDIGLYPDGVVVPESIAESETPLSVSDKLGLKMALGTSAFWLIGISFFIQNFSALGFSQNQVPHFQDIGYSIATAATVLTAIGLGSTIGKFIFGWLCDHIQAKYACSISIGLLAIGTFLLMSVGPSSPLILLWLYALILGLGGGGWLPTMSMLISTNFGMTSYGAIFGTITLIHSLGGATGPFFAGYMYDTMNTYNFAFIIFLASYVIAIPAVLAVRHSKSLEQDDQVPLAE